MDCRPQQRVVADGWGQQASGSVFCADSSLRYIYESHPQAPAPGTAAAAIKSLASGDFGESKPTSTSMLKPSTTGYMGHSADKLQTVMSTRGADGVDLHEAEIAKACAHVTKQLPSLPHSFRECSVCLTQNAYAQIAVCGHTFHSKCFLRWFRTNRSCPLCRGHVDKIQLAPVLSIQDELEAIMAEMDENETIDDPLIESPDLISFLSADFDADMDMMALEDMPSVMPLEASVVTKMEPNQDDVDMEDDDQEARGAERAQPSTIPSTSAMPAPAPVMQFAPSSTMPNYWNVLNQGLSMPSVTPLQPRPPQHQHQAHQSTSQNAAMQHRVVHIAPKPDGHLHYQGHQHQHLPPHVTQAIYGQLQAAAAHSHHHHPFAGHGTPSDAVASTAAASTPRVVSCRCTGGCRNGRCACVKEGAMCGVACRCTSCKNPFLMVKAAGADIDALLQDACFMHNVSKTRDMVQRLQEPVQVPCCERMIKVIDCVQGYNCVSCRHTYDFSWCTNKLLDHERTPRNHCEICKRCCDHRDVHCHDCGRCYFAGVAASLPCPCKESSRKRREQPDVTAKDDVGVTIDGEEEDKDGECTIM
ncbi:hypothetical protein Poli38472_004994 [Pythium oligandrum]|uniref:RING-type domain-containing protein n=1 Tax=Pythium oligandrum TaxID=41045 RepID=A0A8K1FDY3_PYTOL|nr:hypothetical protein Poli38472_004994 [Pythium oligandrum]|eukprot:TMW59925.1 hypothetical protein Poli38472_004994 [Pythium oligandrum]